MKSLSIAISIAFLSVGCATTTTTNTTTASGTSATTQSEVRDLNWSQVKAALTKGALLVDVRSAADYAQGHIDGAITAPVADATAFAKLTQRRSAHVIFYGAGLVSKHTQQAAAKAVDAGFAQVSEYRDGFPGWLMRM